MRPFLLSAALVVILSACSKPTETAQGTPSEAAAGPLERPELTVRDIMDTMVDPSGDFLFESVRDIVDAKGVRREEPRTDADWAEVRKQWLVLHDEAPRLLSQPGRRAGRPENQPEHPEIENPPAAVQALMDAQRPDWIVRVQRLKDAADEGLKATAARNVTAHSAALLTLDKACESCHIHYFYPNDQRAHQAAKADGVIE